MEGGEGQAGLIPGLILQEQRMATKTNNNNEKSSSIGCGGANRRRKKKNKKMNYSANKNSGIYQIFRRFLQLIKLCLSQPTGVL